MRFPGTAPGGGPTPPAPPGRSHSTSCTHRPPRPAGIVDPERKWWRNTPRPANNRILASGSNAGGEGLDQNDASWAQIPLVGAIHESPSACLSRLQHRLNLRHDLRTSLAATFQARSFSSRLFHHAVQRLAQRAERAVFGLIDEDVPIGQIQNALLALHLPQPIDDLECDERLARSGRHRDQNTRLTPNHGFDGVIDWNRLIVTRALPPTSSK